MSLSDIVAPVRDAPWLGPERARAWLRAQVLVCLVLAAGWLLLSRHGLDAAGRPIGTDFVSFWSAGRLAAEGAPAAAYDPARHGAVEHAAVAGAWGGYTPFPYPPSFLLVCLPFGVLPYLPALAAWLAAGGAAFLAALRRWLPPGAGLAAVASPAVLINALNGQNGFVSAALFGAGTLALGARPLLGGGMLGLLAFKPHLGLLVPVALAAGGRWRAFAAATASAAALTIASALAFGPAAWTAFFPQLAAMRTIVESGALDPGKVISLFAALRVWGAPLPVAYAAQGVLTLAAAAGVACAARRKGEGSGAVLIAGALLASPYLLDYDLTLAAFPAAWLLARGLRDGFQPWEKVVLLAAYVLPLAARPLALTLHLPLAPLVLSALFLLTLRRSTEASPRA